MTQVAYLDSSALVKLVVREPQTSALRRFLGRRRDLASSALARTEVIRAVRPLGPEAVRRARALLRRIDLVRIDDALLDAAATLDPPPLRSLDAIHLAAALALGEDLDLVVTYDLRMQRATVGLGLIVSAPA
jgi:predicted nucleic acid-binding protein